MKKILLSMVTLSVLIFALSGCGVFSQPELGNVWNLEGISQITTDYDNLTSGLYVITINLEFGTIFDANKVKKGTVEFDPNIVVSDDRIVLSAIEFNVIEGSYDPTRKFLLLNCEESGAGTRKIQLQAHVVNNNQVADTNKGAIYKSSDLSDSIGNFYGEKQN